MKKLDKRVVVITGGSSGIGLACARLFEKEGAQVVLFAEARMAWKKPLAQSEVLNVSEAM
jgi:NAD(P)-dependent dehydrogenase (short-subunit alcohol dehydrogenase family)